VMILLTRRPEWSTGRILRGPLFCCARLLYYFADILVIHPL
jgi:hypothetical protein